MGRHSLVAYYPMLGRNLDRPVHRSRRGVTHLAIGRARMDAGLAMVEAQRTKSAPCIQQLVGIDSAA